MIDRRSLIFILISLLVALAVIAVIIVTLPTTVPEEPAGPNEENGSEEPKNNNRDTSESSLEKEIAAQGNIKEFADTEELKEFLQKNDTSSSNYSGRGAMNQEFSEKEMTEDAVAVKEAPTGDMEEADMETGEADYSETNIQVEGVDEADIVKTDGEYIYAVSGENIFIIEATPGSEAETVSRIELDSSPENIYLREGRLAAFGTDSQTPEKEELSGISRRSGFSFFKIFDVRDKEDPTEIKEWSIEGNYFDSRMIGDHVYFVTSNRNYHYREDEPVLPEIVEEGERLINDCDGGKCLDPDVYYFDAPYDSYNFTNITAINISDEEEDINSEMYLFSGNQEMYVSTENIYITYTKNLNPDRVMMEATLDMIMPELPKEEQTKIEEIRQTEEYILTEREKWQKIEDVVERGVQSMSEEKEKELKDRFEEYIEQKWQDLRQQMERTVIHKIAIEEGRFDYQNRGEVTGHVLNQFSMSEKGDHFRIATTKNRDWGNIPVEDEDRQSYSNVYILDKEMNVTGSVENLAPGENIFSARFMQDRAYLVTFEQVDPLFVIDLEDPQDPEVLGELKVPGFSDYLHPYDEDTLIGVGKETELKDDRPVEIGMKVSLFDVSDVSDPELLDDHVMGGRGSSALVSNDHKAFLFSKDRDLLVLPVSLRTEEEGEEPEPTPDAVPPTEEDRDIPPSRPAPYSYTRGAAVFNVDGENLELRDTITHGTGENSSEQIKRGLYIEDNLYTLSNDYLGIHNLGDLERPIKELELE